MPYCHVHCHLTFQAPGRFQESDTGLAPPSQWDLEGDKQMMKQAQLPGAVGVGGYLNGLSHVTMLYSTQTGL